MKPPYSSFCQAISHRYPLKPVARDKSIHRERDLRYLFFSRERYVQEKTRITFSQGGIVIDDTSIDG